LPDFIVRRHAALFDRIICGNSFLAQELEKWNRRVVIVPTAVDTDRFVPAQQRPVVRSICWTGSSSNLKYLYQVGGAIAVVLAKYPDVRLRIICDAPPVCPDLDPRRVDYIPWSETGELKVEGATIGIMPLDDTLWSRGKCSYKMLCYMACGIPVVASPVGMNAEVLGMDAVGIGASGPHEWVDGLSSLLNSPTESDRLGRNGRRLAVSRFSVGAIAPTLASELKSLF
jgi:glycosyltransferase involved in cell wall biosynthesis